MKKSIFQLVAIALLGGLFNTVMAQPAASGQVSQTVGSYYEMIYTIGNIIFGILMVFGVVKVVSSFISNSPNGPRNLIYLILGAVIWFGFNLIVEDVESTSGGSKGGYVLKR